MSALLASSFNSNYGLDNNNSTDEQIVNNNVNSSSSLDGLPNKEELIGKLKVILGKSAEIIIKDLLNTNRRIYIQPTPGSVYIAKLTGNQTLRNGDIISMYFHPDKEHCAWTNGLYSVKESYAKAGEWAVSAQTKSGNNNTAGYKTKMPHDPKFNENTWNEWARYTMYKGIGWDTFQLDGRINDCVIC